MCVCVCVFPFIVYFIHFPCTKNTILIKLLLSLTLPSLYSLHSLPPLTQLIPSTPSLHSLHSLNSLPPLTPSTHSTHSLHSHPPLRPLTLLPPLTPLSHSLTHFLPLSTPSSPRQTNAWTTMSTVRIGPRRASVLQTQPGCMSTASLPAKNVVSVKW